MIYTPYPSPVGVASNTTEALAPLLGQLDWLAMNFLERIFGAGRLDAMREMRQRRRDAVFRKRRGRAGDDARAPVRNLRIATGPQA